MDNASQDFLAKEEGKYKARVNGFIDEGIKSNASGDHSVDWSSVQKDYASGELKSTDVHAIHNKWQGQLAAAKQPTATAPATKPSVVGDMVRQAGAGVVKFATEESRFMNEVVDWSKNNLLNLRAMKGGNQSPLQMLMGAGTLAADAGYKAVTGADRSKASLEAAKNVDSMLPKAETTAGAITGGISQFMAGMVGFGKYLKGAKGLEAVGRSAVASGVVGGTGMNPDDSMAVHAINKLSPDIKAAGMDYLLAPDGELNQSTKRLVSTIENAGFSVAADGVIAGFKGLRNLYKARGQNPAELAAKVEEVAAKESLVAPVVDSGLPKTRTARDLQSLVKASEDAHIAQANHKANKVLPDNAESPKTSFDAHQAVQDATTRLEEAVSGEVKSHPVPLELRQAIIANKPAFLRTADDLVDSAEWSRLHPAPEVKPIETPVGSGKSLSDTERATALTPPKSIQPTAEYVADRLKAVEKDTAPLNNSIIKIEQGKSINTAERQALMQEVADRINSIQAAARASVKAGNTELLNSGVIDRGGMLDFAKYAQQRGIGDASVAEKLSGIILGSSKEQVTGSVVGAVTGASLSPAIILADTGDMTEDQKKSYMDKFLMSALFMVAGRFGYKALFKGTKGMEAIAAKDAAEVSAKESVISQATKVASTLPKSITPLVNPNVIKALPRINVDKVKALSEAMAKGDAEGAALAQKEIFNFDHIETGEDIEALIKETASVFSSETDRATRGVITHLETEKIAEDLGTSLGALKTIYSDTSMLAERLTAARNLLPAAAERSFALAKEVQALGNADRATKDAAILALRKQVMVHSSIQMQLKGVQTEIGRSLSAMRIQSSTDKLVLNEMNELVESFGGRQVNEDFANRLIDVFEKGDSAATHRFARASALAKSTDAVKAYWYSSVLSGISTHFANIVSNVGNLVEGTWERGLGIAIGKAFGTKGAEHYVAMDYMKGVALGNKVALGLVSREFPAIQGGTVTRAFRENAPVLDRFGGTKIDGTLSQGLEAGQPFAISSAAQGVAKDSLLGQALDLSGKYVFSVPGRALVAEDELFKAMNYYGELYMQASAAGRSKGLVGNELEAHLASMLAEPSTELHEMAIRAAREGTFTSQLGETGNAIVNAVNKSQVGFLFMPFIRTPINIMKHFAERLPGIGMLMENNKVMMEAGGLQRNLVIAKQATGAMYVMGALGLAQSGMITGGGLLDSRKEAESLAGKQPYSIKVGATYYSYNRLDPVGFFLGLTADWYEYGANRASEGEKATFTGASMTILANFMESKTYIRGLAGLMDILNQASKDGGQPGKAAEKQFGQLVGSLYPSLLAGANKSYGDPHAKEFWEWSDKVKERIYGLSDGVPDKRNIFGQIQELEGGLGADIASPIYVKTANPALAAKEIGRLNVDVTRPSHKIGKVELTAKQYDTLMSLYGVTKISGKTFQEALEAKMSSPKWETMSEDRGGYAGAKETFIKHTYQQYTRAVKHDFFKLHPEVSIEVRKDKSNARLAREGMELFQVNHADPYSDTSE